jgi:hypothetical protein
MVAAVPMVFTISPISALEKQRSLRNGFTIDPPRLSPNL